MKKLLNTLRRKFWLIIPIILVLYFIMLGLTYIVKDGTTFSDLLNYTGLAGLGLLVVLGVVGFLFGIFMTFRDIYLSKRKK